MKKIAASELILNADGSVFHLHLKPEEIADTIILVGDPGRVETVSSFFNSIEIKVQNREFITHTGYFNNKRISVISTGIGTDNIDIVVNELDALTNIDLKNRVIKENHKSLNLIRIGTSGALQKDIPIDSILVSKMAIGFDGLLNFYANRDKVSNLEMEKAFVEYANWSKSLTSPYFVEASENLLNNIAYDLRHGITISAPGFYAPQGRVLRLELANPNLNKAIENFEYNGKKITNFEMESSAIFGLSKLMRHEAITFCAIIANRILHQYSSDYKIIVKKLIKEVLERISGH